ncbi:hypothetical protein [Paraferrimonas sp. SM1919]|uniref:hypothetical protein n=1 Tax=Paraferrimonas sp. SM1919 TaxID=2662263 RepID=UPI0013D29CA9|nr:hypothetical protein [Paraferrimonas sp. SM1919]
MDVHHIMELFERYKQRNKITSDKALAENLGISKAYLCDIKKGRRRLSDKLGIFMAYSLGQDPQQLLIELRVIYAKQAEEKITWKKILVNWNRAQHI